MKDTSGSAFPRPGNEGYDYGNQPGMTRRQWLAGLAMSGLCANPGGPYQANDVNGWGTVNCTVSQIAGEAYGIADAMLEFEEKEGKQ